MTVVSIVLGGLAQPLAQVILVLPGLVAIRGSNSDMIAICIGCLAAMFIVHIATAAEALEITRANLRPPILSWLGSALAALSIFAFVNWASAKSRLDRLWLLRNASKRAEDDNAVKFTPIGAVSIAISPAEADRIAFAVEDTGPGVPPDKVERIFESFIQADQSETRQHGGLGLRLAIARKRARQLGGDVIYQPRPQQGLVFTVLVLRNFSTN